MYLHITQMNFMRNKFNSNDLKFQVQLFETKRQLQEIQQSNAQKEKIALGKIVQDQKVSYLCT